MDQWPDPADEPHGKDTTAKRFPCDIDNPVQKHLAGVMAAQTFARRIKTLGDQPPCKYICQAGPSAPERVIPDKVRQMPGPKT